MPFDVDKIKREAKSNYEKAWLETKNLLKLKGNYFNLQSKGRAHPVDDFISDARKKMISLGFEELILPMFVEEEEIYKQYGPEAALILDRLFYLAGLPRPDIGISKEKILVITAKDANLDLNVKVDALPCHMDVQARYIMILFVFMASKKNSNS